MEREKGIQKIKAREGLSYRDAAKRVTVPATPLEPAKNAVRDPTPVRTQLRAPWARSQATSGRVQKQTSSAIDRNNVQGGKTAAVAMKSVYTQTSNDAGTSMYNESPMVNREDLVPLNEIFTAFLLDVVTRTVKTDAINQRCAKICHAVEIYYKKKIDKDKILNTVRTNLQKTTPTPIIQKTTTASIQKPTTTSTNQKPMQTQTNRVAGKSNNQQNG
jgi:hypothetical protein